MILSGTIEEKVYHRQVYKQFMTDKVLKDPRQKRFFKAKDLSDLFTLGDEYAEGTETAAIFSSLGPAAAMTEIDDGSKEDGGEDDGEDGGEDDGEKEEVEGEADDAAAKVAMPERDVADQIRDENQPTGDASILKDLFDHGGMHSALDHDKIEGAHNPQNNFARKEARKVAERAAKALRDSRQTLMCRY